MDISKERWKIIMKKGMVSVLSLMIGGVAGAVGITYFNNKAVDEKQGKIDKFKGYYNMLNQWLILKQEGKSLEKFFVDKGYKSIAIYGMGEMGNRLYDELKETSIDVKYAIDKNAASTYSELEVYDLEQDLPEVDAVVVTATFAFKDIEKEISGVIKGRLVSLDDVVFEC